MLTLTGWLVRVTAVALPRDSRARYAEQWSADVRDADHAGVRRFQIVFGAFRVAGGIVRREVLGPELKATLSWIHPVAMLLLLAIPLCIAVVRDDVLHIFGGGGIALAGSFGVFSEFMSGGPAIYLLFPVSVVLVSCLRLYKEVPKFKRVTMRKEGYLFSRLITAAGISFAVFALSTFLLFVLAYYSGLPWETRPLISVRIS